MKDAIFKFRMSSLPDPSLAFSLASDGEKVEYSGKDREGNPLNVDFDVPRDEMKILVSRLEPILLENSDESSEAPEKGAIWSMTWKTGGMALQEDGYIRLDNHIILLKEDALEVLEDLKHSFSISPVNVQAIESLINNTSVFQ